MNSSCSFPVPISHYSFSLGTIYLQRNVIGNISAIFYIRLTIRCSFEVSISNVLLWHGCKYYLIMRYISTSALDMLMLVISHILNIINRMLKYINSVFLLFLVKFVMLISILSATFG